MKIKLLYILLVFNCTYSIAQIQKIISPDTSAISSFGGYVNLSDSYSNISGSINNSGIPKLYFYSKDNTQWKYSQSIIKNYKFDSRAIISNNKFILKLTGSSAPRTK